MLAAAFIAHAGRDVLLLARACVCTVDVLLAATQCIAAVMIGFMKETQVVLFTLCAPILFKIM